jgi:hypothetical protein
MRRVIANAVAVAAVAGAIVLFGTSVRDLATWKVSGLDSVFLLNASIIGALLFSLCVQIDAPHEPPSIVGR